MSAPKFFVVLSDGAHLHRFALARFTQHQDDPSCWCSDRAGAKRYTVEQIAKMRPLLTTFHGEFAVVPVQS